ncbi:TetR/AcrR family transcriptional regulator [Alteribacillus iranensis]|uniref:Regulatory protein, tetR family n=1 Tax=Alteribacillus iranensis TaxID=930128 RepID=A0A1I2DIV5_9BACI|nr:TetR/AcrR family transcriptional regulator [Alteribacillus iranensis]SFE80359.1 regulatory protein, tetR family [Alteribacillus iranensis]
MSEAALTNKEKQKLRMWQYFVDATIDIIEEKGIDSITIREIADKAGYNSATIYNYFKELSHLIFFASLKYLNKYLEELPSYMEKGKNPLDKYIMSWECFCKHSFKNPQVYYAIFLADLGDDPEEFLENYYSIYQLNIFKDMTEDIKTFLTEYYLSKRSRMELDNSVNERFLKKEDLQDINEKTILIWQGMVITLLNNRREYTPKEAADKTVKHIKEIVNSYRLK